jgi:hypothetical protein
MSSSLFVLQLRSYLNPMDFNVLTDHETHDTRESEVKEIVKNDVDRSHESSIGVLRTNSYPLSNAFIFVGSVSLQTVTYGLKLQQREEFIHCR